jgi:arginine metabolism regulation protein II
MGAALNRGLVSGSVDASLDEIETRSTTIFPPYGDITIGPFTVLNFATTPRKPDGAFASDAAERAPEQSHSGVFNDCLHSAHISLAPEELGGLTDDLLQWSDIFGLNDNLFGITSNLSVVSRDYPSFLSSSSWLASESEMYNASLSMDLDPTHDMLGVHVERQEHCTSILHPQTTIASPTGAVDILNDASFLLKVFQKHVVPQLTVVPLGKKVPWNILNVPTAIITLADMTVMEAQDITHARQANLFSLLSCSAMYLSVTPSAGYGDSISTPHWQQVASQAYYEAKNHMRISLSEETDGPTKSKYKDQLMAICAMIESAVSKSHALITSSDVESSN